MFIYNLACWLAHSECFSAHAQPYAHIHAMTETYPENNLGALADPELQEGGTKFLGVWKSKPLVRGQRDEVPLKLTFSYSDTNFLTKLLHKFGKFSLFGGSRPPDFGVGRSWRSQGVVGGSWMGREISLYLIGLWCRKYIEYRLYTQFF